MAGEVTVTIVGNLGGDPQLRTVGNGSTVCDFSVGVTPRTYNRNTNQWDNGETTWYRCNAWDTQRQTLATNIANTFSKGMRVIVTGTLSTRSFTGNDGQQRTNVEVRVVDAGPALSNSTAQVARVNGGNGGYSGGGYRGGNGGGYSGGNGGYRGGNGGYDSSNNNRANSNGGGNPGQNSQRNNNAGNNSDPWGAVPDGGGASFGSFGSTGGGSDDEFGAADF